MESEISSSAVQRVIEDCLVALRNDLGMTPIADLSVQTPLMGEGSDMDSMTVVHLIADLESRLQTVFGREWILADERALSRHRSPFRSIGDLTQFIMETADV